MILYRFLFAPALLAVAVLSGAGEGAHGASPSTRRGAAPAELAVPARVTPPEIAPASAAAPRLPTGSDRARRPHLGADR